MKSFIKNASKLLLLLIIIPIISLSFVACKKKPTPDNGKKENETPTIEEVDDNPNSPIKSGIYYFEKELTPNDIFYIDEEKVIEHFNTIDINGVRRAILNLGFVEFAKNITEIDNLPKCIEFNSKNEVTTYKNDNNVFTSLEKFVYVYDSASSTFKNSDNLAPAISYDAENNDVYLLYPFTYTSNDNKMVVAPLYIKAKLIYKCNTFEALTSENTTTSFTFKSNSTEIVTSSPDTDLSVVNAKIAEIFNIELSEDVNVLAEVENILSKYSFSIKNDFSLIVSYKNLDGTLTFSLSTISNKSFNLGSTTINFAIQEFDKNAEEISLYITINEESALQFTLKNVVETPTEDVNE